MALGDLFNPLLSALKRALGPFGKLFDLLSKFWTRITSLWKNISKLVDSITAEINEWRRFKTNVESYRTGVISIPKAVDRARDTVDAIVAAKDAVVDLWQDLRGKFESTGNPTEEAEQAIKDIEGSGLRGILEKFPKLVRGAEKVLGFIAIVADALESILNAIDDLQKIVDAIKAVREEAEDTVFLQQRNARKTVKLLDGGSMKIRVGSLHSSD